MIGRSDVIETGCIQRIAVDFEQRAVILEVLRYVRVAVHIAAIDLVLLAVVAHYVAANGFYVGGFVYVNRDRFGERLDQELKAGQCKCRDASRAETRAKD